MPPLPECRLGSIQGCRTGQNNTSGRSSRINLPKCICSHNCAEMAFSRAGTAITRTAAFNVPSSLATRGCRPE